MSVKNPFLAFSWIGDYKEYPAMAKAKMGNFHFLGNTSQDDLLMAPVKLIRLSWGKLQWNIALLRSAAFLLTPVLLSTIGVPR